MACNNLFKNRVYLAFSTLHLCICDCAWNLRFSFDSLPLLDISLQKFCVVEMEREGRKKSFSLVAHVMCGKNYFTRGMTLWEKS